MAKKTKANREKGVVRGEMARRVRRLYLVFVLFALFIVGRLIWVSAISEEVDLNSIKIRSRIFFPDSIYARRGTILSRHGDPMAISVLRYKVQFDMASEGFDDEEVFEEQVDSLSKLLSAYFGDRTPEQYAKVFHDYRKKRFEVIDTKRDELVYRETGLLQMIWDRIWNNKISVRIYDTVRDHHPVNVLPRSIDYSEWQVLKNYPILNMNMGVTYSLKPDDNRAYPYDELGRRTLGNIGDRGAYGIEHAYQEELKATHSVVTRQRIARGYSRIVHSEKNADAVDGKDIVTTLDPELQHIADAALREQLRTNDAVWGTTIVMEVATGDILAMVNLSETARGSGKYYEGYDNSIRRPMEPGSTFKLAAMLALLDDCKMSPTQQYNTHNGQTVQVGGPKGPDITDDHPIGNYVDLKKAFAESSNVYFTTAIYEHYKNRPKDYNKFLQGLHLDQKMGLDRLGEATPRLAKTWNAHTLPNMGYGYVVELAPIHTLTLYNAIANGGRMVAPRLVTQIRQGDKVIEEFPVKVLVDKVCSDNTLKIVRECLREVVVSGTGKKIFGDTLRYNLGAKTGTARVSQSGVVYDDNHYLGSVALFYPFDKPKYSIITVIYAEKARTPKYHGATLAGPVCREIIDYLMYRDGGWRESFSFEGDGSKRPEAVKGNYASVAPPVTDSIMPDVRGMGLKDALYALESRGLKVSFTGAGAVWEQSIEPGTILTGMKSVKISLK